MANYDTSLVILSVIVAMLASFTGFNFAARSRTESGAARVWWLAGGAFTMGVGMWSAHATGLLAFAYSGPVRYDVLTMLLSAMIAIVVSSGALAIINRPKAGSAIIVPAALLMGVAMLGMVYAGIASIRLDTSVSYDHRPSRSRC